MTWTACATRCSSSPPCGETSRSSPATARSTRGPGPERGGTTNRPCVSSPRSPAMPPRTTPRCAPGSGIRTGSSWRAGSTRSLTCGGCERRSSAPSVSARHRPAAGSSPPSGTERQSSACACGPTRSTWPASSPPATGARSSCRWDISTSRSVGDDGRGRLVLRNSGSERTGPLHCGQPLVGSLLNSSLERVGGYSGAIAGTGRTIDLAPGESASIRIIFGTASTRADLGYVVPPGQYWLKVQMRLQRGRGDPETNAPAAPLTRITVIPRDRELRADQASAIEDKCADHPI
jgi:hypothetical protein